MMTDVVGDISPETVSISGEVVNIIDVDGVLCDAEKAREAVKRVVNAVIVMRRWERRHHLFPDIMEPLPAREIRRFVKELDDALVGGLSAETDS